MSACTKATLGLPYQGSKRRIATKIVDLFPEAPALVDVFAGGCAVTHAALLSGKFGKVIANDLSDAPALFYYCLKYGVPEIPRWVSRDEFHALKDRDPLIRYCYSFKNDGRSYLYGREIEPLKHAAHLAVVDGDFSGLPAGIKGAAQISLNGVSGVAQRYSAFIRIARDFGTNAVDSVHLAHVEHFSRIQHLSCVNRIAGIRQDALHSAALIVYQKDYRDLYIPDDAVVYCDPPYASTADYGGTFDRRAFYAWCRAVRKLHPVFVSEYWMPSDFRCIAEFIVRSLAGAKTNAQTRVEKIFTI